MDSLKPVRITLLLASTNIAVFLAMVLSGVSILDPHPIALIDWGALYGPLTIGHQWWRTGSSMFLHVGVVHLVLNLLCLLSLGPIAEAAFGSSTFLAGYLLAGLGGAITSLAVHPTYVGAGASGAIFGTASWLLVAGVSSKYRYQDPSLSTATGRLGVFLIANLLYGLFRPEIDNAAHIGGLVIGALLGLPMLFGRPRPNSFAARPGLLAAGGLIVVGAFGVAEVHYLSPGDRVAAQFEVAAGRMQRQNGARADSAATVLSTNLRDRVATLQATIRQHPDSILAYVLLAEARSLQGNADEAELTLRQGLMYAPGDVSLLTALGNLYLNHQQFDEAVAAYEQVLAADTNSADARYNLAYAYQGQGIAATEAGDRSKAVAAWKRVLKLHADSQLDEAASRNLDSL